MAKIIFSLPLRGATLAVDLAHDGPPPTLGIIGGIGVGTGAPNVFIVRDGDTSYYAMDHYDNEGCVRKCNVYPLSETDFFFRNNAVSDSRIGSVDFESDVYSANVSGGGSCTISKTIDLNTVQHGTESTSAGALTTDCEDRELNILCLNDRRGRRHDLGPYGQDGAGL
ncbi:hypothetical protein SUNI508_11811 [Seiridium unicorne]|uniref:Uncharacterized protein n=1 Tax=Seiridium unicorne TaxID=138068 RepID=A0ABR2UG57_9PEZI